MALHVSISAETIAHIGSLAVTNSLFTGSIVSLLLLLFVFTFSSKKPSLKKVSRLQSLVELIIEGIYNLTTDIAGAKKAREFFPLIATFIIFILFNNWIGLLPGVGTIGITEEPASQEQEHEDFALTNQVHAAEDDHLAQELPVMEEIDHVDSVEPVTVNSHQEPDAETSHEEESEHGPKFIPLFRAATADINTTLALALLSVVLTQYYGIKYLGLSYFQKFINLKQGPIFTFVGLLEIISEIAKIISFAFRLFGNIFAGEVLLAVIAFLVPIIGPIPFLGLEIFVGFIQALVFGMLTLVFINMATIGHGDDH